MSFLLAAALLMSPNPTELEVVKQAVVICQAAEDPYTGAVRSEKLKPLIEPLPKDAQLDIVKICYAYSAGVLSGIEHTSAAIGK